MADNDLTTADFLQWAYGRRPEDFKSAPTYDPYAPYTPEPPPPSPGASSDTDCEGCWSSTPGSVGAPGSNARAKRSDREPSRIASGLSARLSDGAPPQATLGSGSLIHSRQGERLRMCLKWGDEGLRETPFANV